MQKLIGLLIGFALGAAPAWASNVTLAADTSPCQTRLLRYSSRANPEMFWEHLHHALSVHALFQRVEASDLPAAEKSLVEALDHDQFAPQMERSTKFPPYLLGSIEHIVDLLRLGVSSFERVEGPVHGELGYERVGYRIVHLDQKVSYLMSKRLIEGCATCRERENVFLLASHSSPLLNEVRVTKGDHGSDLVESHISELAAETMWSSFWQGQLP